MDKFVLNYEYEIKNLHKGTIEKVCDLIKGCRTAVHKPFLTAKK